MAKSEIETEGYRNQTMKEGVKAGVKEGVKEGVKQNAKWMLAGGVKGKVDGDRFIADPKSKMAYYPVKIIGEKMGFNNRTIHNLYSTIGCKKIYARGSDFGFSNRNPLLVVDVKVARKFLYCGMLKELYIIEGKSPKYYGYNILAKFKQIFVKRSNLTEMMEVLKAMFQKQTEKRVSNLLNKVSKGINAASDKVVSDLVKEIKELKEAIRRNTEATEKNTDATIDNTTAILPYELKNKVDHNLEIRRLNLKTYDDVLRTIAAKEKSGISPYAWKNLVNISKEYGFYN